MKKFVEILEDIKTTIRAIEDAKKEQEDITSEMRGVARGFRSDMDQESLKKFKSMHEQGEVVQEKARDLALTRKILENNACVALYNETLPVVVEILEKYKGKAYGEKTREKINVEFMEKTGCRIYIGGNYGQTQVSIYPQMAFGNSFSIAMNTEYIEGKQAAFLIENKIQAVPSEEIKCWIYKEYVEDIAGRINELKAIYKEAYEKKIELEAICSKFNGLAVGNIPHIYGDKHIYATMTV